MIHNIFFNIVFQMHVAFGDLLTWTLLNTEHIKTLITVCNRKWKNEKKKKKLNDKTNNSLKDRVEHVGLGASDTFSDKR